MKVKVALPWKSCDSTTEKRNQVTTSQNWNISNEHYVNREIWKKPPDPTSSWYVTRQNADKAAVSAGWFLL